MKNLYNTNYNREQKRWFQKIWVFWSSILPYQRQLSEEKLQNYT